MKRASYQSGSVVLKERKLGPDVWVFRYKEDGIQRSKILGTIVKFKTKAAARKEASKQLEKINERLAGITVAGLCDRFEKEGLPARHSSSAPYLSHLKRVRGEWGSWRVTDMSQDVMAIERWINEYRTLGTPNTPPRDASKKTKQHVKAFIHRLFECAMKWGLLTMQRNPIGLIEVKGKRRRFRALVLVTSDQFRALIADPELPQHVRVMVQIAMLLGLRASEILGLRWEDVDFEAGTITIRRSHVDQYVDDTKTPESEAELPLHVELAEVLTAWKEYAPSVEGWMFGNIITKRPWWRGTLQQDHLAPAGRRAGIPNLGWHAFRHTYRAMMRELNISIEDQRTLMRHADITTTMNYGGKASASKSRPANAQVVEMVRRQA